MKAPDKIYVSRNFSEDNSPHGLWYLDKSEHDINVEYLRKDSLLEWASRLKEKWEEPPMSKHSPGCVYMLEQLIKKLDSM